MILDEVGAYMRHAAATGSTTDLQHLLAEWGDDHHHILDEADEQVTHTGHCMGPVWHVNVTAK